MADLTGFRTMFPEFAPTDKYPDPYAQIWLDMAAKFVNADRWGDTADFGIYLWTAHYLVLEQRAQKSAAGAGVPGGSIGILTSKSVDGVSASYDVATATEKDAGQWNLTTYGTRFIQLARLMGVGPVQVGVDPFPTNGAVSMNPYAPYWG